MENPFESPAPGAAAAAQPGSLDLGLAFRDGWEAMLRNMLPWLLVSLVAALCAGLSLVACLVPAIVVVPALTWGSTRFTLDAVDGEADFNTLWKGFDRLGQVVPTMLVLFLAYLVSQIPLFALGAVAAMVVPADDVALQAASTAMQQGVSTVWNALVLSRFQLSLYAVVDRDENAIDALTHSWQLTEGHWLYMAALQIAAGLLLIAGLLGCCVGAFFTIMIAEGAQASAWRQLTGTRR